MIINMGPQHPSTHGVLRLMLELEGETVLRTKPIVGYLHTGMEKTGEDLTYLQGATNVTRMDYAAPLFNELVFSMATEKLLGIDEDIPERAVWIRMLLCELNRISSHLLFMATNGMDLGAVSMMIYGWREREEVPALLREGHRPADEPQLHPPRRRGRRPARRLARRRAAVPRLLPQPRRVRRAHHRPAHLARAPPGVGVITPRRPRLGATGPILRSTGVAWDLRRDLPYLRYDQVDFDVLVGQLRRLLRPLRHPPQRDPRVDAHRPPDPRPHAPGRLPHPGQEGHAAAAGPHRRVDGGAHPPLQDLHRGLQGARGRGLRGRRVPRGELGCYIVSDGTAKPVPHAHPGPSFVNLQTLPHMMRGGLIADAVAIISSVDPIMGEVDR
jgi:NADH-quinone oxidoreductase subunit D